MRKNEIQKPKHYLSLRRKEQVECPNCQTQFQGNFCPTCGQSTTEVDKPFKEFLNDILGSLYAFDSRFWCSIGLMFSNPAKLSNAYLQGKRARYTPPFKLYFFVSFLFFFTINWMTKDSLNDNKQLLTDNDGNIVTIGEAVDSLSAVSLDTMTDVIPFTVDSLYSELDVKNDSVSTNSKNKYFNFSEGRLKSILDNPEGRKLFMNRVFKFISWMLFLLMPIFAFILKMLYARRKQNYVKHLVFAVNTHTQTFLILILFFVLNHYIGDNLSRFHDILLFAFPLYLLIGMKTYYKQGWLKTIAKFFILTSLYNFVLLAALVIVFVIAFGTY